MPAIRSKKEVLSILKKEQGKLKELGIKKIALFGSYVRNTQTKKSDIDFVVEFKKGKKTYDNFIKASNFLEKLYGKKIDLVTKESISPYIKPYIIKEMVYVSFNA